MTKMGSEIECKIKKEYLFEKHVENLVGRERDMSGV